MLQLPADIELYMKFSSRLVLKCEARTNETSIVTRAFLHSPSSCVIFRPINEHGFDASHVSIVTNKELLAEDVEDARVASKAKLHFFMTVVHTKDLGPGGPGVAFGARCGRFGKNLERCDRLGSLNKQNKPS